MIPSFFSIKISSIVLEFLRKEIVAWLFNLNECLFFGPNEGNLFIFSIFVKETFDSIGFWLLFDILEACKSFSSKILDSSRFILLNFSLSVRFLDNGILK